jgi:membrane associated rhomboid family serine protease
LVLERSAFLAGEVWRALSAPLVHGYPALLVVDLVGLAAIGAWVESGSRRAWLAVVGSAGLASSLVVLAFTDLERYVGSSAIVDALLVYGGLQEIAERPRSLLARVSRVALGLLAAKILLESAGAWSPALGTLPDGVEAVPLAHLTGGMAGAALAVGLRRR